METSRQELQRLLSIPVDRRSDRQDIRIADLEAELQDAEDLDAIMRCVAAEYEAEHATPANQIDRAVQAIKPPAKLRTGQQRILDYLRINDRKTPTEIHHALGLEGDASKTRHKLRRMKAAGLVTSNEDKYSVTF